MRGAQRPAVQVHVVHGGGTCKERYILATGEGLVRYSLHAAWGRFHAQGSPEESGAPSHVLVGLAQVRLQRGGALSGSWPLACAPQQLSHPIARVCTVKCLLGGPGHPAARAVRVKGFQTPTALEGAC